MSARVDTVTLMVPVSKLHEHLLCDLSSKQRTVNTRTGEVRSHTEARLPSGMHLRTYGSSAEGLLIGLSGSIPRLIRGSNALPASVEEAQEVVGRVILPELSEVTDDIRTDSILLSRLDTVVDLACPADDIPKVLEALAGLPMRRGLHRSMHRSASSRTETLWTRNRSGGVRLYNKGLEARRRREEHPVSEGLLRCEAQNHKKWLERYGLRSLNQLSESAVKTLLKRRMNWAGHDLPVVAVSTWVERVHEYCNRRQFSPAKTRGFLGLGVSSASGIESPAAPATRTAYRKMVREIGVPSISSADSEHHEFVLDFDSEQVVKRKKADF